MKKPVKYQKIKAQDLAARIAPQLDEQLDTLNAAIASGDQEKIEQAKKDLQAINDTLTVLGYWKKPLKKSKQLQSASN